MPVSITSRNVSRAVLAFAAAGGLAGPALMRAETPTPRAVIVEMSAKRFAFLPEQVDVIEGDDVTLNVRSADGTHGIEIAKLKVKKVLPRNGQTVTLSFTAPAPGRYVITCSEYCGRGHDEMKSVLVVAPRSAGPYLTSGQMQIIRRWIELGAKND